MIINNKAKFIFKQITQQLHFNTYKTFSTSPSIEQQLQELREKVKWNSIFDNVKKSEKEYNDLIDDSFKVYPIVLQLQKHEENALSEQYYNFLEFIATKKRSKTLNTDVNDQLINHLQERIFKNQSENYLKIERVSTTTKGGNTQKQFHLLHRGHLQIFGVSANRGENEFIHKYTFQKNTAELRFTRRVTSQEKLETLNIKDIMPEELQGKTTKMKKQIEDIMSKENSELDENASQGIRGTFLNMAKKLGYDFSDNKIDGSEYVNKLSDFKKQTFQNMRRKEEYILVEDFLLRTSESIRIKALSGEILWEDQPDSNGLFHHYLRTEALCDLNEAPSVKNDRKRTITDIDGKLRGNPPCLVKRFDLVNQ